MILDNKRRRAQPDRRWAPVWLVGHILDFQGDGKGHRCPDTLFCRLERIIRIAVAYNLLIFPAQHKISGVIAVLFQFIIGFIRRYVPGESDGILGGGFAGKRFAVENSLTIVPF